MKLLLFDFDGVIVDSFETAYDTMKEVNKKPTFTRDEYKKMFYGNIFKYKEGDEDYAIPLDDPFFAVYGPRLLKLDPVQGMKNVLETFKDHNMAVVSSTIREPIETYLKKNALDMYFNDIYGADVHKSKVVKIKMAVEDFNATISETIFVTDTLGDLREGTRVGVQTIGVTWGFHDRETLSKGDAIAIVDSPDELLKLL